MADAQATPRTATRTPTGIVDQIDDALARIRAVHVTTCLAASADDFGVGQLGADDLAALRGLVDDLLNDVKGAVAELHNLAAATPV